MIGEGVISDMVKESGWKKEFAVALAKAAKQSNKHGIVLKKKRPIK